MPNIHITVANKIATNTTPGVVIVCGNGDYTATFDFDSEWDAETERTARFVYYKDGMRLYKDVPFTDTTVAVPPLSNIGYVEIGVYTSSMHTTTPAKVLCDRSILCGEAMEMLSPEEKAALQAQIGDLSKLCTNAKDNLVAAINEVSKNPSTESGGNVDLTGYATEQYVQGYAQPKGNYLTEVPEGYAKTEDIPTVPTNVSAFTNDAGYLTEHQDISGKLDADKLPDAINDALAQAKESGEFDGRDGEDYVLTPDDKTEIAEMAAELVDVPESSGSGIHIGPDAPTDSNVNVWIDTDEEPEEAPETGSGIDVTAAVGQTIIVEEVDGNGKPTKWKAVDFPETVQSDWNAPEVESGHVLNRTHYKNWVNVLPVTELIDGGEGLFMAELTADIDPFCLHRVTYNGTVYECMPICTGYDSFMKLNCGMGNLAMIGMGEDTGEPFVVASGEGAVMVMPLDGATSVTISVDEYKTEELPKDYYASTYFLDVTETDGIYTTTATYAEVYKALRKGCNIVVRCGSFLYQPYFYDVTMPSLMIFYFLKINGYGEYLTLSVLADQLQNNWNEAVYSCEHSEKRLID